jgi:hypothetical protein
LFVKHSDLSLVGMHLFQYLFVLSLDVLPCFSGTCVE